MTLDKNIGNLSIGNDKFVIEISKTQTKTTPQTSPNELVVNCYDHNRKLGLERETIIF